MSNNEHYQTIKQLADEVKQANGVTGKIIHGAKFGICYVYGSTTWAGGQVVKGASWAGNQVKNLWNSLFD